MSRHQIEEMLRQEAEILLSPAATPEDRQIALQVLNDIYDNAGYGTPAMPRVKAAVAEIDKMLLGVILRTIGTTKKRWQDE